MSDAPDKLMLVYLRRLDTKMDQVIETLRDHGRRLTSLELGVANNAATAMGNHANQSLRADHFDERLSRIERRLDLAETPSNF
jgi:hypothetical protein